MKYFCLVAVLAFTATSLSAAPIPREGKIAYARLTDGYWQIWLKETDGEARRLTSSPFDKRTPAWSADGKRLVYRSGNRELFLYDLASEQEQRILAKLGWITDPKFFRTGERLLFVRFDSNLKDQTDIWTSDLEGKERRLLTKKAGLQFAPDLSPDENELVYVSGELHGKQEIYRLNLETGKEKPLTDNDALELTPVWSPDGGRIAYASNESGNFDIYVMDPKGRRTKKLTEWEGTDQSPVWSPDGKELVFVSDRSGRLGIWLMGSEGGDLRPLLDDNEPIQEPAWYGPKD